MQPSFSGRLGAKTNHMREGEPNLVGPNANIHFTKKLLLKSGNSQAKIVKVPCKRPKQLGDVESTEIHAFVSGTHDEYINLVSFEGCHKRTTTRHMIIKRADWQNFVDSLQPEK